MLFVDKAATLLRYTRVDSPVGPLLLVADDAGLRKIYFEKGRDRVRPDSSWKEDDNFFKGPISQLRSYFAGKLKEFDLPLAPEGTTFQRDVWQRLCEIPYGETISYGQLARQMGNRNASRAVGLANGSNPIPIVIPCHRVIGSNGKLTGYGGGLPIKEKLLALERGQLRLL
ncbi:MAG TPA: methylated-DNA--[protein]-cysteine S-methyltransferase [Terriglobales bacterium]|nr:methylated-DNA--[protein]-cysteine S-methyltransferase [Terriglobales bacterium]